jgi:two-component system phosphate regulon sensor histidine kinase PhoR
MQQALLLEKLPFDISIADSIYNSLLQQNNIPFKYQVNYLDAHDEIVEIANSKIYHGFETNIIPIVNGMKVQAIVKIDPPVVFKKMLWIFIIYVVILLMIIICLIYEIHVFIAQHQLEVLRKNFTHSMTHNMKTPLGTIHAVLDQLNKGSLDKNLKMRKQFNQIAIAEVEKLQAIVDRILTIARINKKQLTLNKQPIDIPLMISSLIEKFSMKDDKTILFSEAYDLKDSIVYADPFYLCDAIGNLIDNSIKYSEKTVRIDIECSADEKQIYIRIKDDGFGISPIDQQKIFEPFERGNEINRKQISGFGLGLNYVNRVIRAHGGNIALSSRENIGSEFTIILPSVLESIKNELSDYGQN